MKRRILFISNHLRGPKGAAGTRSWQQTRQLCELFDITVAVPAIDPVTVQPVTSETFDGLDKECVTVKLISSTPLDRGSKLSRLFFYFTVGFGQFRVGLTVRQPACILVMSLPITSLWVGMLLSWIKRCPLVVDVRDLPFETAAEIGYLGNGYITKLAIFAESFALKQAALVICNSARYKPMLVKRGVLAERIEVLVIGYDDFDPPSPNLVSEFRDIFSGSFGNSAPEYIGIYVGTFGQVVEVETVLAAAKLLRNRQDLGFVFVGSGQRLAEYQLLAEQEGLNVYFTGRVAKDHVQAMCRASDFCFYAAKPGTMSAAMLGNKLFDYLGAERPVIYSGPDSAVLDVIKELNAGLATDANDAVALANSIVPICDDPDLRQQFSRNAAGFRLRGYTGPASAVRLKELIAKLLDVTS